jgi:regulator of RNase E activity RraA
VQIRESGFPVFCRGTVPTDSNGRSEVRAHNVPVVIDEVRIEPGDLVVADDDGVAIVPAALIDTVVGMAQEKDTHESRFRAAVVEGMTATEAFAKFGVL